MDKTGKERIAKAIVGIDDAIKNSGGLAELLGHVFAFFVAMSFGANLASGVVEEKETEEI
jgi:hypothetical protein